ncbi:MAG: hypothetical protein GWN32_13785 [Gemmatimonadetes bacterium]|nr:hypothetical protein [Gemmatimonadota bacterium]
MSDPFQEFERLVKRLETGLERTRTEGRARAEAKLRAWQPAAARWAIRIWLGLAAVLLPFYLLVGGSVLAYRRFGVPTWPALLVGVLLTALLLLVYAALVSKKVSGRLRVPSFVPRAIVALVGAYSLYALIYLSALNVKPGVEDTYRSLHPLLRLATSTLILADGDLVITDMERAAEDYERMGLPLYERSLHFRQGDGYAHAVDLRTLGRSGPRNFLVQMYFRAMGFRTLRHVGTAEHLHVSLPN